ncbi:plasmid pRiA4b ORF-3 family protein [Neobacillus sp. OS1-33]|uniref:plasmid pRiA4b ORF-3 family protein n=1 Tax=Neobacillus sp. OS1-33 TaxID=3070683 RepID=UPI0027DFC8EF|nr:plasmid pRiA4b ORF-3 family protein [Neobacillus sp. OS1-33]WML26246.1 plasmid pRiA4b ORF-3 family protein [Neobacillus sp. OS1-33]
MIFQLKITIKESKPPIWRRIEIGDSMTFSDLHKAIQIAFEWGDYHLHGFDIRRSNSVQLNNRVYIGPMDDSQHGFSDYEFNEEDVLLKDVFIQEKDRVVYTYDFGDNWEHEILLEKVFAEEVSTFYPRCTKAMRAAPKEDSRFDYLETGIVTENINSNEEIEDINEELRNLFGHLAEVNLENSGNQSDQGEGPTTNPNWHRLLEMADEFKGLKPWQWLGDGQFIAVEDPVTKEYVYCSIMGGAGLEFGLAAYIGEQGKRFLNGLLMQSSFDEKYYIKQRSLILSFSNREELNNEDYQILKETGTSYRGKNQWPLFRSYQPGYYPWILDAEEVRLLSLVIEQVIEVSRIVKDDSKLLSAFDSHIVARVFDEKSNKWETVLLRDQENMIKVEESSLFINELELQELKNSLKYYNIPLEFDSEYMLAPIQDHRNERPYYPTLVLSVERKNGLIVYNEILKNGDTAEANQNAFLELIKQLNRIPKEVWVKEEMAQYIKPIAKKLQIKLLTVQTLPLLDHARKEMEMMMPV